METEEKNSAKTLAAGGSGENSEGTNPAKPLGNDENQGMEIVLPEGKCDTMETTEGAGESEQGNSSKEASSLMLLKPGSVKVQETTPSSSRCHATVRKRCLVEVFAVLFMQKEETLGVHPILDDHLILSTDLTLLTTRYKDPIAHVLYNVSSNKSLQINSEDCLILTGPERGIEVDDYFFVNTSYISDTGIAYAVWNGTQDLSEIFMCDWLESRYGFMVVNFAVYRDGLEAQLELNISDLELHGMPGLKMPLEVYGTVRTSNSCVLHREAKSYLFDHVSGDQCAILDFALSSKAVVPLPLSRRVTVIPRESTLIVDVSLSLRCPSGDISIANESVSFHASTRSNSTVEEHIIKGHHANVKVKVSWIAAFEYDKKRGQEKEVSIKEDGEAVDEEFDRKDGKVTKSEDMSDDDRSFGLEDVSTRPDDYHITEDKDIADWGQGACLLPESPQRVRKKYLEVFSVKLLEVEISKLDEIYGFIIIDTGVLALLLFRHVRGYPSRIDSEGYAILEGPRRCGWNVGNYVYIVPLLFKYQDPDFTDDKLRCELWRDDYNDSSLYDKLLFKMLSTDIGKIAVNFDVYTDGVEVHLSLMLIDCSSWAQVHGTIAASNSMLQEPAAESFVLKKDKAEADRINTGLGKEISLPLSRPIVALPFNSILILRFNIFSEDELIIRQAFEFPVQLVGEYERILPGIGCGVKVNLRYFSYEGCQYMDDKSSFF